jgi:peptidyl-prolyl isomerase G (cyclophilin G)
VLTSGFCGTVADESPKLKHDGPGLLSMSIADRDALGSQFIVTFRANHHLDRFVT